MVMANNAVRLSLKIFAVLAITVSATLGFAEKSSGENMAKAAQVFLSSLTPEQKAKAVFTFQDSERTRWHFIPLQDKEKNPTRKGLRMQEMSVEQKKIALSLLQSGTSKEGFDRARKIMGLESYLKDAEKGAGLVRNSEWYFVSIFGEPSDGKSWGWRFEGHHLSLNYTLNGTSVVSATPAFFGANPAEIKQGPRKGEIPIPETDQTARKLIASLTEDQINTASKKGFFDEIEQAKTVGKEFPRGLSISKLDEPQKAIVKELLKGYSLRFPKDVADKELARLSGEDFARLDFSYSIDPTKTGKPYTYRLQGPDLLIEFLNIQADGNGNPANHIHSSWRAAQGDFGIRQVQK